MKQTWLRLAARIDALSLRERAIIFAMTALVLLASIKTFLLDAQFIRENQLSQQITHDQSQIAGMQTEIQQKVRVAVDDPDADDLLHLNQLKLQDTQLHTSLLDMQKGLIAPERMNDLLRDMLVQNGKLRLVSLKTLPTASLNEPDAASGHAATKAAPTPSTDGAKETVKLGGADIVYRHGVEIVIEGDYGDMVNYMSALESMPWQLFWAQAKLQADDMSKLTLTLRVFTLSLDKKWLNI